MKPDEHLIHTAPLRWLADKLHKGVAFEDRVRAMRARRWRDKLTPKPNVMPDEESEITNEPQD